MVWVKEDGKGQDWLNLPQRDQTLMEFVLSAVTLLDPRTQQHKSIPHESDSSPTTREQGWKNPAFFSLIISQKEDSKVRFSCFVFVSQNGAQTNLSFVWKHKKCVFSPLTMETVKPVKTDTNHWRVNLWQFWATHQFLTPEALCLRLRNKLRATEMSLLNAA